MRSLANRRVHHPKLEARFELPDRPRPRLPVWLATALAFSMAGPAFLIPGVALLITASHVDLSALTRLAEVTIAGAAWTLVSWGAGPFVLRARGYPAVVSRRVERRWLSRNAKKLIEALQAEEQVLDVVGVHKSSMTEGAPMVIYVLTNRRILLVRTAKLIPFGRTLPILRSIPLGAIGAVSARAASILKRARTVFDVGRGSGLLEVAVLGDRDLRLRFPSHEEAALAEEILSRAMRLGTTAGPGALAIAALDDERGALAVAGAHGEAGALSPAERPRKSAPPPEMGLPSGDMMRNVGAGCSNGEDRPAGVSSTPPHRDEPHAGARDDLLHRSRDA